MVERCGRAANEPSGTQLLRATYIHKAEHLGERRLMLQWWADYLDANREKGVSPFDFAKLITL